MNVRGDDSQRRLNYYSRSSPKKKKTQYHTNSPLLPPTPLLSSRRNPTLPIRSQPHSLHSSFRLEVQEVSFSGSSREILIEEAQEEEILIEDGPQLEDPSARVIISHFQSEPSPNPTTQPQSSTHTPSPLKNNDIRIQDDQNNQAGGEEAEKARQSLDFIRIENQEVDLPQTMSRQFTFGQQLAQAQKAEIEQVPLPTTNEEDEYSSPASSARPDKQGVFGQEIPYFESNMEYEEQRRKPEINLDLIEASSSFDELYDDYQSPKFNAVPLVKPDDKWITAEDYHFLTSPRKEERGEILIESDRPSDRSSARVSLSDRPFGECITLLSDLMPDVPEQLRKVYEQMHRKLVADQIKAQEQLQRQQARIKILRMLLLLRKKGVKCEQFLLSAGSREQEQIELNKIMIHSLIKRVSAHKPK